MAKYRLKRKCYNAITDAASNTLGGVTSGVGKAMDTKLGGAVGGLIGGQYLGGAIGSALSGLGWFSGPVGWLAGAALGSAATRGLGKGLKSAGQDLQTY